MLLKENVWNAIVKDMEDKIADIINLAANITLNAKTN